MKYDNSVRLMGETIYMETTETPNLFKYGWLIMHGEEIAGFIPSDKYLDELNKMDMPKHNFKFWLINNHEYSIRNIRYGIKNTALRTKIDSYFLSIDIKISYGDSGVTWSPIEE